MALSATLVMAAAAGSILTGAAPAPVYRDSPPAGYTGGFGEQGCDACHFMNPVDDPAGTLTLEGVPERYTPGEAYRIRVILTRPDMQVGGFQLAARFEDNGGQAGSLAVEPGESERSRVTTSRDVQYAHHLLPGSDLAAPDTAAWTLIWTAPEGPGAVHFPVAANAADGDDSVSGDYVYKVVGKSRGR